MSNTYFEYCAVNGCKSNSESNPSLGFHSFPKPNAHLVYVKNVFGELDTSDKLKEWKRVLKLTKVANNKKVCSLHFKRDDYILSDDPTKKKTLKMLAVPSCNLPSTVQKIKKDNTSLKKQRKKNDDNVQKNHSQIAVENHIALGKECTEVLAQSSTIQNAHNNVLSVHEEINTLNTPPVMQMIGVQVNTVEVQFLKIINLSPCNLPITTGENQAVDESRKRNATCQEKSELEIERKKIKIISNEACNDIEITKVSTNEINHLINVEENEKPIPEPMSTSKAAEFIQQVNKVTGIQPKSSNDIGIQVQSNYIPIKFSSTITSDSELNTVTGLQNFKVLETIEILIKNIVPCDELKLDLRDAIIMTFVKLKQNLSYAMIAFLFKYNSKTCKEIIFKIIDILYSALKVAIYWPSKDDILQIFPLYFQDVKDVRVILNFVEIKIQKPNNFCCQTTTISNYKSQYTAKFLIGITPAGLICFVSESYGGSTSNKAIFEQSKIIKKLDKKDTIIVNNSVCIDDECKENDIKLIKLEFLKNKEQFSKEDAILARNILRMRVLIERCNKKLKTFAIFNATMPASLCSKVDEIFLILCAIINLSAPII